MISTEVNTFDVLSLKKMFEWPFYTGFMVGSYCLVILSPCVCVEKALSRLRKWAVSTEPLLVAYSIISYQNPIKVAYTYFYKQELGKGPSHPYADHCTTAVDQLCLLAPLPWGWSRST